MVLETLHSECRRYCIGNQFAKKPFSSTASPEMLDGKAMSLSMTCHCFKWVMLMSQATHTFCTRIYCGARKSMLPFLIFMGDVGELG